MGNPETKLSEESQPGRKKYSRQLFSGQPVFLMCSLFILLLIYPFFLHTKFAGFALDAIYTLIMFTAAWTVYKKRFWLIIACVLGVPWILINWTRTLILAGVFPNFVPSHVAYTAVFVSHILFIGFVEYSMFVAILRDERVTKNTLYRAVSGYLLLGLLWAAGYALIGHYDPNAFSSEFLGGSSDRISWNNYLYFSYVTLSTLGYGDIIPLSAHARSLAITEMVVGPLYLAVLIARLVAMYRADPKPTA